MTKDKQDAAAEAAAKAEARVKAAEAEAKAKADAEAAEAEAAARAAEDAAKLAEAEAKAKAEDEARAAEQFRVRLAKARSVGETAIRFVREHVVQDEHVGTARETRFAVGDVTFVSLASAAHYTSRGAAVEL